MLLVDWPMPDKCSLCPFYTYFESDSYGDCLLLHDDYSEINEGFEGKLDKCPLIEVDWLLEFVDFEGGEKYRQWLWTNW